MNFKLTYLELYPHCISRGLKQIAAITLLAGAFVSSIHAAEFIPLGILGEANVPGFDPLLSRVTGISSDGSVVTGWSSAETGHVAYLWRLQEGMQIISDGNLQRRPIVSDDGSTMTWTEHAGGVESTKIWSTQNGITSFPHTPDTPWFNVGLPGPSISADGSIITGVHAYWGGVHTWTPAYWTRDSGIVDLPIPAGAGSRANLVSSDGSTIAGSYLIDDSIFNDRVSYRWDSENGLTILTQSPASASGFRLNDAEPLAMSSDGSVVVGRGLKIGRGNLATEHIWRWTAETGTEIIVDNTDVLTDVAVSSNGDIVVFELTDDDSSEVYLWTPSTGLQNLPQLPGFDFQLYYDMSDEGDSILGVSGNTSDDAFFWLWNEANGVRRLSEILLEQGLANDLEGWDFWPSNMRMSSDGRVLAGNARNPDGFEEAFVIYLDPIAVPEPSSLLLVVLGVVAVSPRRRRSYRS